MNDLEKYLEVRQKTNKWQNHGCCDGNQIRLIKRVTKASSKSTDISPAFLEKKFYESRREFRKLYAYALGSLEDVLAASYLSIIEAIYHQGSSIEIFSDVSTKINYWTFIKDVVKDILFEDYVSASNRVRSYALYRHVDLESWTKVRLLYELDLLAEV